MPKLEQVQCPVCQKEFEEGDDIVYCPDCGTPHHRACYKALGHCARTAQHETGYSFWDEMDKKKSETQTVSPGFFAPKTEENAKEPVKENEATPSPFTPFVITDVDTVYDKDTEKIAGESVGDCAAAVRTNIPRFINLFKEFEYKGRKTSWNWGAFFFGAYYLLYRKMYRQGILFLCLQTFASFVGSVALTKLAPKFMQAYADIANAMYAGTNPASIDISAVQNAADYHNATTIFAVLAGVMLVLRLIVALLADKWYKQTVCDIVKAVNEQLGEGATFTASPLSMGADVQNLTADQMKKMYLARRGGTSLFVPLIAYFAINILSTLL